MSDAQAYYDGLIGQNYAPDQALQFTQQHFPDFQPAAAAPAPAPEPAPAPAPAPAPEPAAAAAPAGAPPMAAEPAAAVPMGAAPMGAAPMAAAPPAAETPTTAAPDATGGGDGGGLINMLFKFDGTIGRKQWWVCGIVTGIVVVLIRFVIGLIATATIGALSYLALIPIIAGLWVFVALGVKRLRDRGKEDKMLVIPLIVVPWGFVECGFLPSKD